MRVNVAIPESHVKKPVLDAALEATTRLDESLLSSGSVPLFARAQKRVRWKPEPPGQEHFDHAGLVMERGHGDCDDLAPWHAASLRVTGEDPGARAVVKRSGPKMWHAIVQRSDGTFDDPSLAAGMPGRSSRGVNGAWVPVMFAPGAGQVNGTYIARPQLALRPVRDRHGQVEAWQARADLPWHWQPSASSPGEIAMASLHQSPVSSQAIVGACKGAVRLAEAQGEDDDDDNLDRLAAIADACEGASFEELEDEYGTEHATAAGVLVSGFFGGLKRAVRKIAKPRTLANMAMLPFGGRRVVQKLAPIALPLASKALPFVPGVGPAASLALQYASPMLQRALAERRHEPPEMREQPLPFYGGQQYGSPNSSPYGYGQPFDPMQGMQYFGAMPFR